MDRLSAKDDSYNLEIERISYPIVMTKSFCPIMDELEIPKCAFVSMKVRIHSPFVYNGTKIMSHLRDEKRGLISPKETHIPSSNKNVPHNGNGTSLIHSTSNVSPNPAFANKERAFIGFNLIF